LPGGAITLHASRSWNATKHAEERTPVTSPPGISSRNAAAAMVRQNTVVNCPETPPLK
jgi:hypothetical protein